MATIKGARHQHPERWSGENRAYLRTVGGQTVPIAHAYWRLVAAGRAEIEEACPGCGCTGHPVSGRTVRAIVRRALRPKVEQNEAMRFCETRTCPLLYYDGRSGAYVHHEEAAKRVGQKETAADRTICYCLLVPEEAILREVVEEGCCSTVKDVREYTRANTGKACEVTNPKGECCDQEVEAVIQKGLRLAGREALVEPMRPGQACCQFPEA